MIIAVTKTRTNKIIHIFIIVMWKQHMSMFMINFNDSECIKLLFGKKKQGNWGFGQIFDGVSSPFYWRFKPFWDSTNFDEVSSSFDTVSSPYSENSIPLKILSIFMGFLALFSEDSSPFEILPFFMKFLTLLMEFLTLLRKFLAHSRFFQFWRSI